MDKEVHAVDEGKVELKIFKIEDRLAIAQILVKNGYTVRQEKRSGANGAKAPDYYIVATYGDGGLITK